MCKGVNWQCQASLSVKVPRAVATTLILCCGPDMAESPLALWPQQVLEAKSSEKKGLVGPFTLPHVPLAFLEPKLLSVALKPSLANDQYPALLNQTKSPLPHVAFLDLPLLAGCTTPSFGPQLNCPLSSPLECDKSLFLLAIGLCSLNRLKVSQTLGP